MTCYHVSLRMLNSFKRVVMALICSEWSQIDFKRLAFPVQLRQLLYLHQIVMFFEMCEVYGNYGESGTLSMA